ncbi:siderophore-interacting protein [Donghicola sp. XS_ASV15]|uniref:siderophore-interacting protein n=1 Tax=Donghicola sp. XS_ASV15 TaxID=3241295 RepID=UPI0035186441
MNPEKFKQAAEINPRLRRATVLSVTDITPHMRRVVLGGDMMQGFPEGFEGGYIKLVFLDHPASLPDSPVMRTYSIRAHDPENGEITVDFASHSDTGGVAMEWVQSVASGDEIAITGPGKVKMVPEDADWYLIAADMTGLPAALRNVEMLPDSAQGHVILEIPSAEDKQDLALPDGMSLQWVINPAPQALTHPLLDAIKSAEWFDGAPFVWTACEFDTMRALRTYYRTERGVGRDSFYLSSYWRVGRSEDQHKMDKRKDANAAAA